LNPEEIAVVGEKPLSQQEALLKLKELERLTK